MEGGAAAAVFKSPTFSLVPFLLHVAELFVVPENPLSWPSVPLRIVSLSLK